jgi:acyl-CoA synthetase (AMP-forming)/AMP-acid ligase II
MNTLPQILLRSLEEAPDRVAVRLLGEGAAHELSYRRLLEGAAGYAEALSAAGILPGEVVVLILQHGASLIDGFFGAMLRGAVPAIMPFLTEKLSPEHYRASLASLVEITRPAAVVTYSDFEQDVRSAVPSGSSVRAVLLSESVAPAPRPDWSRLPGLSQSPGLICLLQHSSGTTGLQKGVALSHRAVLNQVETYSRAIAMSQDDTVVSWLPLYHDMGLIAGFLMPILLRSSLVLMSPFEWVRAPHRLLQAVSDYRGTLSWLPNFAYNFCASKIRPADLEGVDLSSWRAVINCSEPMRLSSHEAFLERFRPYGLRPESLATCYAMAENVFAVSQGGIDSPVTVDRVDARSLVIDRVARPADGGAHALPMLSAGRPIPNVEVRVLDDSRRDVPERHVGEIAVRSDCMLSGYFHRDDLTAKAFHEGWYLTGDLGYTAGGEVYITGRKKDLIIVGGKNIYPQDIEELAGQVRGVHPGRVVAFGVFNDRAGTEDVVVVAEGDAEDEAESRRIADEIREAVNRGSDVALRFVRVVEPRWLLKTSSGKIARAANREKYLAEASPSPAGAAA